MGKLLWELFWKELEFKRQIAHLLFGLSYAALYVLGIIDSTITLIAFFVVLGFSLYLKSRRSFVDKLVLLIEREKDLFNLPLSGLLYFLLGCGLTIHFFDFLPALTGIVVLSITDSIGTLYGKYLGNIKIKWNPEKHIEGPVLGTFVSAVLCMSFLPVMPALIASFTGALIDTFNLRIGKYKIDDNLLIPIAAAIITQLFLN